MTQDGLSGSTSKTKLLLEIALVISNLAIAALTIVHLMTPQQVVIPEPAGPWGPSTLVYALEELADTAHQ